MARPLALVLLATLAACAVTPSAPPAQRDGAAQSRGTAKKEDAAKKEDTDDDDAAQEPVTSASPTEPTEPAGACPKASAPESVGVVDAKEISEASGIVASKANADVYWVHNDSGDSARVFAIGKTGALLATLTFDSATPEDIEDIAIEDGPDGSFLYLADIGDNDEVRPEIVIHRVAEPKLGAATKAKLTAASLTMRVQYPDGPHNAETLLFDPIAKELFIATKVKAGSAEIHRVGAFKAGGSATTSKIAEVPLAVANGGDISRDGSRVALRSLAGEALVWTRAAGESLAALFAREPCRVPVAADEQAEAFAFLPDGSGYITIAEGRKPSLDVARFE